MSLEALADVIDQGGDADDVLRGAVAALVAEPHISWASIRFLEEGALVPGPVAGTPDEEHRIATPIAYRGEPVGELVVDGEVDATLLATAAELLAAYVLLGWDTGGETWEP